MIRFQKYSHTGTIKRKQALQVHLIGSLHIMFLWCRRGRLHWLPKIYIDREGGIL